MIIDIETRKVVTGIPHRPTWDLLTSRLTPAKLDAIRAAIDVLIVGHEVRVAAWMPGNDWRGTPFQPIHDNAARGDDDLSGRMFGLLAWEAFQRHPERWGSIKQEQQGRDLQTRVYFRVR